MRPFPTSATVAKWRATVRATRGEEISLLRDEIALASQAVSFFRPRPRPGEEQAVSPQGAVLGIRGGVKLDIRQGDTFEYDGAVWEVVTVYPLTGSSIGRKAEADYKGAVVEET